MPNLDDVAEADSSHYLNTSFCLLCDPVEEDGCVSSVGLALNVSKDGEYENLSNFFVQVFESMRVSAKYPEGTQKFGLYQHVENAAPFANDHTMEDEGLSVGTIYGVDTGRDGQTTYGIAYEKRGYTEEGVQEFFLSEAETAAADALQAYKLVESCELESILPTWRRQQVGLKRPLRVKKGQFLALYNPRRILKLSYINGGFRGAFEDCPFRFAYARGSPSKALESGFVRLNCSNNPENPIGINIVVSRAPEEG